MIKRIEIENIESHEKTVLDLAEHNVITGSSGSGKSAFLRAISFLLFYDKTEGRYDDKRSSVVISCEDRRSISRIREDSIQYECSQCGYNETEKYTICPSCHCRQIKVKRTKKKDIYLLNGIPFEKMGRGFGNLSEDIKQDYPIPFVELDDKHFVFPGFHTQFEGFLHTQLSGADMNRLFSLLEGHDFVEELIKLVRSEARKTNGEVETRTKDAETFKVRLKQEKVDLLTEHKNYKAIEKRYNQVTELYKELVLLDVELSNFNELTGKIERITRDIGSIKVIDVEQLKENHKHYKNLLDFQEKLVKNVRSIKELKQKISDLKTKDIVGLRLLYDQYSSAKRDYMEYIRISSCVNTLSNNIKTIEDEQIEFTKVVKKEFLDKNLCPFSGYPIATACKKRILHE